MTKQKIAAMLATLDTVEVRGRKNLDALLACIQALEEELNALQLQEQKEAHHAHHTND